jgi:hypothetical protein
LVEIKRDHHVTASRPIGGLAFPTKQSVGRLTRLSSALVITTAFVVVVGYSVVAGSGVVAGTALKNWSSGRDNWRWHCCIKSTILKLFKLFVEKQFGMLCGAGSAII